MPPRAKYSKDEIIRTSLDIIAEKGVNALSAREIAKKLNISTSPVFTYFANMEELGKDVRLYAINKFYDYINMVNDCMPVFVWKGIRQVRFAKDFPNIFRFLFLKADGDYKDELNREIFFADEDLDKIADEYRLPKELVKKYINRFWIYVFGWCVLAIENMQPVNEQDLETEFTDMIEGMILHKRKEDTKSE